VSSIRFEYAVRHVGRLDLTLGHYQTTTDLKEKYIHVLTLFYIKSLFTTARKYYQGETLRFLRYHVVPLWFEK